MNRMPFPATMRLPDPNAIVVGGAAGRCGRGAVGNADPGRTR
jgi:hypothetical protein